MRHRRPSMTIGALAALTLVLSMTGSVTGTAASDPAAAPKDSRISAEYFVPGVKTVEARNAIASTRTTHSPDIPLSLPTCPFPAAAAI